MAIYDAARISETIPLLRWADDHTPQWVEFQTDDPVLLKRVVHWLLTNTQSPLGWAPEGKPTRKAVIEWRHGDKDGWSSDIQAPPVYGPVGRHGRLRFRQPRTQ